MAREQTRTSNKTDAKTIAQGLHTHQHAFRISKPSSQRSICFPLLGKEDVSENGLGLQRRLQNRQTLRISMH
jgi:hypothetical protein